MYQGIVLRHKRLYGRPVYTGRKYTSWIWMKLNLPHNLYLSLNILKILLIEKLFIYFEWC